MRLAQVLVLFLFSALASTALARTWYVAADGSGDAPNVAAAVDSSISGDVILVGPGTHYVSRASGGGVVLRAGTELVSESGPAVTFLRPGNPPFQPGLVDALDDCVVSGFNVRGSLASPLYVGGDHVEFSNNVVDGGGGGAAILVGGRFASIHHNVCFGTNGGIYLGVDFFGAEIYNNVILDGIGHTDPCPISVQIHCNLINGSTSACPFRLNNFSADPMFCGDDNYYLQADSPCAPGNHPDGIDCGQIGPLPVGCTPVSVKATTWGNIKAMYR